LAGKKTRTIGLVINEIDANYYNDVVGVIERKLKQYNHSLLIALTGFEVDNQIHYVKLFLQKRVDGLIIKSDNNDLFSEKLQKMRGFPDIPVVLLGKPVPGIELNVIENDDLHAMRLVIDHLTDLGHKNIFFIGDKISQTRKLLFLKLLQEKGVQADNSLVREGNERFELGGYLRMSELLTENGGNFAVVAHYDSMANGAMKAVYEKNLRVPENVSITGFDNIQESEYYCVPLTTVEFPNTEIGSLAVQMLFEEIKKGNRSFKKNILLKPRLVIRESTCSVG